jgi:hypothetical protein
MADLGHFFAEKSYIGNKKDGISTGLPAIDLMSSESNELSIHCLEHGNKESYSTTGDSKATRLLSLHSRDIFLLVRMLLLISKFKCRFCDQLLVRIHIWIVMLQSREPPFEKAGAYKQLTTLGSLFCIIFLLSLATTSMFGSWTNC